MGVYVAAKASKTTSNFIDNFIQAYNIPFSQKIIDYGKHVTLCYSRAPMNPFFINKRCDYLALPAGWHVFENNGNRDLVLKLNSNKLVERWNYFRSCGASWDYPEFTPHITFSYDIGDFDETRLPDYTGVIFLDEEYAEELKE